MSNDQRTLLRSEQEGINTGLVRLKIPGDSVQGAGSIGFNPLGWTDKQEITGTRQGTLVAICLDKSQNCLVEFQNNRWQTSHIVADGIQA